MFRIILFLLLILPTNLYAKECTEEINLIAEKHNISVFCDVSLFKQTDTDVGGNNRGSSARLEIAYDLPEFDTLSLIAKSVTGGNNTVSVIFRWTEGW